MLFLEHKKTAEAMIQWTGKKAMVKKYQISNKELLHILDKGEVAYTYVDGVCLVDEESFVRYLNTLRVAEKQDNAVHRLRQALRSGKKPELDKYESVIARRLESRVVAVYHIISNSLGVLLEPLEQEIFHAFLRGDSIGSVARQTGLKCEEVFYIFESSLLALDKYASGLLVPLVRRAEEAEKVNLELLQKLTECDNWFSHVRSQLEEMDEKIAGTQRHNDSLKSHLDYLQSLLDSEKRINAELERIIADRPHHIPTNYLSSIKSYLCRLFHFVRD